VATRALLNPGGIAHRGERKVSYFFLLRLKGCGVPASAAGDALPRRGDPVRFKIKAMDCECLGISFHPLTPSVLLPMIVIEMLDAHTLPVDVAL
jgi:hypothetical protein